MSAEPMLHLCRHDNIADLLGIRVASFEREHEDAMRDIKRELIRYVRKLKARVSGVPMDSAADAQPYIRFDAQGYPELVGMKATTKVPKRPLENLCREYLNAHYGESAETESLAEGDTA